MKAVIADDEPHLAQYLRDKLARLWPELEIAAVADSGPAAKVGGAYSISITGGCGAVRALAPVAPMAHPLHRPNQSPCASR